MIHNSFLQEDRCGILLHLGKCGKSKIRDLSNFLCYPFSQVQDQLLEMEKNTIVVLSTENHSRMAELTPKGCKLYFHLLDFLKDSEE